MSKMVKEMVTCELRQRYDGFDSACVIDMTGLSVQQQESLRNRLGEKSARVQVVKNSLARRAFEGLPLAPLGAVLKGPCALVTASDALIDTAKLLVEAAKEFEALTLKEAIIEGDPNLITVEQLSKMRTRAEIVGEIGMLVSSPGRAIAGCLTAPQSKIAGCLKAIVEKAA